MFNNREMNINDLCQFIIYFLLCNMMVNNRDMVLLERVLKETLREILDGYNISISDNNESENWIPLICEDDIYKFSYEVPKEHIRKFLNVVGCRRLNLLSEYIMNNTINIECIVEISKETNSPEKSKIFYSFKYDITDQSNGELVNQDRQILEDAFNYDNANYRSITVRLRNEAVLKRTLYSYMDNIMNNNELIITN
jgi:hypothetical protein